MSDAAKAAIWLAGVVILLVLMESVPRVGGALLLLLVAYFAVTITQKGVA